MSKYLIVRVDTILTIRRLLSQFVPRLTQTHIHTKLNREDYGHMITEHPTRENRVI